MAASSSVEGGIGINDGAGGGGGGGGRRFLRPVPPPASKGGAGGGGGNGPQRRGLFTVLTKQRRHGDELEDEEEEDQATLPNPRLHAAAAADGEVGRLRRERESLLVSGNYGEADPIVEAVGEGGGVGVPGGVASQTSTITFSEERGASV